MLTSHQAPAVRRSKEAVEQNNGRSAEGGRSLTDLEVVVARAQAAQHIASGSHSPLHTTIKVYMVCMPVVPVTRN